MRKQTFYKSKITGETKTFKEWILHFDDLFEKDYYDPYFTPLTWFSHCIKMGYLVLVKK